jgi:peptidoglycan/xylan/chitin deacetylase (PgdA/CDA1 family)
MATSISFFGRNVMEWVVPTFDFRRPRVSQTLVRAAQSAIYFSGAGALFVRARSRAGAMILMYHGVVDSDEARWIDPRFSVSISTFEAQMRFLRHHRHVISMTELVDTIDRNETVRPGTVVITFDDGYKNTLDVAAQVLKRYDLPAIVYLATGYVSREEPQFIDVLFASFRGRTRHALDLPDLDIDASSNLRDPEISRQIYLALAHRLMVSSFEDRERLLGEVVDQLGARDRAPRLTLTWEEVRRLRRVHPLFEIGVHTRNHVDLTSSSPATVSNEISSSADDLRRELGTTPLHFSFPFGRSNDGARTAATEAKLRSAAITEPAFLASSGADVFGLSRMSAPDTMSLFPFYTSGAYPDLSLKLLGRA